MSDTIIRVENLGKRYRLGANRSNERYTALRDVIADKVSSLFRQSKSELSSDSIGDARDFWALKDVNFEVKRGEVLGIIGRNGAGKSTLLKILSRITDPTEGQITLRGRVASLLEVGTGFHPELTGRENIFLNGAILGMHRHEIKAKFDEIVAFAETEKFLDTPVKRYSSGMYVRLAFAVAAHLEPEILIVDEILAVGDAQFQKKCLGKMQDVSKGGRTVIFVSHNMGSIQRLCSAGLLLKSGRLLFVGSSAEAVSRYVNSAETNISADFEADETKPSITRIAIDEGRLKAGDLLVSVSFASPFALSPPIAGIVITSQSGVPVFGSNPRFHGVENQGSTMASGIAQVDVRKIPLSPGSYHISAWLGDWETDYDSKPDAISFDLRIDQSIATRPPSDLIGYLDWRSTWSVRSTA